MFADFSTFLVIISVIIGLYVEINLFMRFFLEEAKFQAMVTADFDMNFRR